jgi:hypothetical protein
VSASVQVIEKEAGLKETGLSYLSIPQLNPKG